MENKSISVCLILEDGAQQGKIILQRRSKENQNFSYVCQTTWAGKSESKEEIIETVKRECKEELGEEFYNNFDFAKLALASTTAYQMKEQDWESYNFVGKVKEEIFKLVKIHNEGAEFIIIDKEDNIHPLSSGKNPKENIVLFDDQYNFIKELCKSKK